MISHPSGGTGTWYLARVRRYMLAGIGPVVLAGTHFLISLSMLRLEAPAAFGTFTFLFVAAQFTIGLSVALFGAPLQALAATHADEERALSAAAILHATSLMAAFIGIGFCLLARIMGLGLAPALCYAAYTALMILRWVGRAWSYAADRPGRTAWSDITYGMATLGGFGMAAYALGINPEGACYGALSLGAAVSLLPFGRAYLVRLIAFPSRREQAAYGAIWTQQSRWALLGVVASEAAANTHVYLVTFGAGAAAMAPLAAAALMLRPINVVQNALSEFERPQMAALIRSGAARDLRRTIRLFLGVLLAAWLVSAVLAAIVVQVAPTLVFSAEYDLGVIRTASASWMLVTLLILLQVPANVMVQAAGGFRQLARATICSSLVNVLAVALALALVGAVWTVAAMAIGWLVDLVLVQRAARERLRTLADGRLPEPQPLA